MNKNYAHNMPKNHVHFSCPLFMSILYGHTIYTIFNWRKLILLLTLDIFQYSIVRVSMDMDCPCPWKGNISYFGGIP